MNPVIRVLLFVGLFCVSGKLFAQFPYFESFKNSTASDITFGGSPSSFLTAGVIDPEGEGYLRLTNNTKDQRGFIHNNTNFSSKNGFKIEFEYFTYGGLADGITFFLYDASVNTFNIGGFGGSLGYAQYQQYPSTPVIAGLSGGYLGVGIDEYGNFANPSEGRQGGVAGPVDGRTPNSVTLRGKGSGTSTDPGNYRYLTHKQTIDPDLGFSIVSGARNPNLSSPDYRKAIIELKSNPLGGYNITVKITVGGSPAVTHTVINNFHYSEPAPPFLRYGIAASTGGQTNYHEIRNVRINQADNIAPVAVDDLDNTTGKNTPIFIPILDNDVDGNGPANIVKSSVVITSKTTGAIISIDPLTGIAKYTPSSGFLGTDTFYYTVSDEEGAVSNIAKVEVQVIGVRPTGTADNAFTTINTPITIPVLANDNSKTDVTVVVAGVAGNTAQGGTVQVNVDGTIKYTPRGGFLGTDTFTYKLRSGDGSESDPILVSILVHAPPTAGNDDAVTFMTVPVDIDLVSNDTDLDGLVDKSSVQIKSPPANGTLTQPDASGTIIYTPSFNFVGTDVFTYTIKDDKGAESLPATVTITVNSVPKIGISKALTSVRNSLNGTFIVRFLFTVGNYGQEPLERISIKDNLADTFTGTEVKVMAINPTGSLKSNNNFDGIGDIELLAPSSTLAPGTKETVELILNVMLISSDGTYQNTAEAEGYSTLNGRKATDASVAGEKPDPFIDGDVSPSGPTFFQLKKGPLYIPQGFSPNNDGINDLFIISNAQGKLVALDVYNRWGNRVYKSSQYKNDWDGRCTEGISLGQDLPVGTYYYIIVIDNADKYVGYITINR